MKNEKFNFEGWSFIWLALIIASFFLGGILKEEERPVIQMVENTQQCPDERARAVLLYALIRTEQASRGNVAGLWYSSAKTWSGRHTWEIQEYNDSLMVNDKTGRWLQTHLLVDSINSNNR